MSRLTRWNDLILPIGLVLSLLVILTPLPGALLDVLLAANITLSVVVLLTTIFVKTPLEFSVFPTLLLAGTLGRLVLNVATTRLILTRAPIDKMMAAGGVVKSFGEFVAGDQLMVGVIVFTILVVIQFVVITKGATRISEVSARFMLDAMPGKQMAIDQDLNAKAIDEKEAQRRRDELSRQADFFAAMDGASKFVQGDAMAGIIITLVNVVGGLFIGVVQSDMTLASAGQLYTKLTIGDGLVSQVPAFLMSLAAGLLITRSSQSLNLPVEFLRQIFSSSRSLYVAAGFLCLLAMTGLPWIPMVTIGGGCVALAFTLDRQAKATRVQEAQAQAKSAEPPPPEPRPEDHLHAAMLEIELNTWLVNLADPRREGNLQQYIKHLRDKVAEEIGLVLPKVRVRNNPELAEHQYRVSILGNPVASGVVYPQLLLALDDGAGSPEVPGARVREPSQGAPAVWIEPAHADFAQLNGYRLIVGPVEVIGMHLEEITKRHADELLTRDALKTLLDEVRRASPAAVDELTPALMKLSEVQQVLQMLLRERVPIRPLSVILEALGDQAGRSKDPTLLMEYARHRMARSICGRLRDAEGKLHVVTLDPAIEDRVAAGVEHKENSFNVRLSPQVVNKICERVALECEKLARLGLPPVLVVSPQIRPAVKQITAARLPRLSVLSYVEITRDTTLESHGIVTDGPPAATAAARTSGRG